MGLHFKPRKGISTSSPGRTAGWLAARELGDVRRATGTTTRPRAARQSKHARRKPSPITGMATDLPDPAASRKQAVGQLGRAGHGPN